MLFTFLVIIHVLICVALIIVVLMQSSKGEGLAGAFGGGGISSAVFGGRGAATFLSRSTTVLAIFFMISCLALSFMSAGRTTASSTEGFDISNRAQQDATQAPGGATPPGELPQEQPAQGGDQQQGTTTDQSGGDQGTSLNDLLNQDQQQQQSGGGDGGNK